MGWLPKDKVVVPVDYSEESLAAVEVARTLVTDCGHLYVVHVLAPMPVNSPELFWETEPFEERVEGCEASLLAKFADEDHRGVHVCAKIGDPGSEIAAYAAEVDTHMISLPALEAKAGSDVENVLVQDAPGEPYHVETMNGDDVQSFMTEDVRSIAEMETIMDAARAMCVSHIHRLVVLDEQGRPTGLISSLDLVAAMVKAIEE